MTRGQKRKAEEAEQRVGDLPRRIPRSVHLNLQRAFEDLHDELEDDEIPHKSYVEAKLDEIDDGERVAELMKDIVCKADGGDVSGLGIILKVDGALKSTKNTAVTGSIPASSEELRRKFKVVANCWEMVRLRMPDLGVLRHYKVELWETYVTWLLGKDICGLTVKNAAGEAIFKPPWSLVLAFDLEVRKLWQRA